MNMLQTLQIIPDPSEPVPVDVTDREYIQTLKDELVTAAALEASTCLAWCKDRTKASLRLHLDACADRSTIALQLNRARQARIDAGKEFI